MKRSGLDAMGAVFVRTARATLRRPVALTFSFAQPLVWMLLFGFLFQSFPVGPQWGPNGYVVYVIPGICAMSVLFGASQSGISLVRDMQTGVLRRFLATPAGGTWILLGKLSADTARLVVQAAITLLVGWILAGTPTLFWTRAPATILAYALFGFAFSALSCSVALLARSPEGMAAYVHLVNMPVLFLSGALVPRRYMPVWIETASRWNPLTLAVDVCRRGLFRNRGLEPFRTLLPLALIGIVLVSAAAILMRRYEDPEA